MAFSSSLSILALVSMVAMRASATTTFNLRTHICCNGTLADKAGSRYMTCCGNTPYDYKKSLCCPHNQVLDIPDGDAMNYGYCYDEATKTSTSYKYNEQECCDGLVLDKPNQTAYYGCCNGQLFDETNMVCCGGVPLELGEYEACCGKQQLYNMKSAMCCEQYEHDAAGIYRIIAFTVSDADRDTDNCCGLQVYNQTTEACCDGVVMPKKGDIGRVTWGQCCGGEPFDAETQFCCSRWGEITPQKYGELESQLYEIEEGTSPSCCGLTLFDYHEEICCSEDTVIVKPEGCDKDEWMSCCGGQAITNYTTQVCYNDTIYQREGYNYYVCGNQLYDQTLQYCCGDQLYDIQMMQSTMECCHRAQQAYNKTTHICCDDEVKEITAEERENNHNACCSVEYYDFTPYAG